MPLILFRLAAGLAAIQGLAHGTLVWRYRPRHGAAEVAVIDAMQRNRFNFGGLTRSYWDFYFGYAMVNAFVCLIEAVLFWQLARMTRSAPRDVAPIAAIFVLFNVGHALLAARFFIPIPIVFDVALAALLAIAGIRSAATRSGHTDVDQHATRASSMPLVRG
ncbi:MAG: hypothetical protein ACHQWU_04645 [Gemmatimonadales bacterium]|jgi:hypothetical protein